MRKIIHLDMDTFFVSVERLFNPSLIGKPVVVGGDPDRRGVVAAASYEVRRYGVHSAMPLARAKRLCPHAVFVKPSGRRYSEFSRRVMEILMRYSPLVEQVSIDEAYMDFSGCERLFGPVLRAASSIKREILTKVGLPASMGISSNRLVSKVASANFAKPNGIFFVPEGSERDFLKNLSVKKLPGVGDHTFRRLTDLGIRKIGDLAEFDRELIAKVFGKYGEYLHRSANGVSDGGVGSEDEDAKSIGKEITFQEDSLDMNFLSSTLFDLSERIGRKLRREGLKAKTVVLKLRYSDFKTITKRQTLPEPTDRDDVVYSVARAQMLKLLTARVRVRLLGISVSNFSKKNYQLRLIEWENDKKKEAYYSTLDRIRERFGYGSVVKCFGEE